MLLLLAINIFSRLSFVLYICVCVCISQSKGHYNNNYIYIYVYIIYNMYMYILYIIHIHIYIFPRMYPHFTNQITGHMVWQWEGYLRLMTVMESSGTHGHSTDGQHELPRRSMNWSRPYPIPRTAAFCRIIYQIIFFLKGELAGFFTESHK